MTAADKKPNDSSIIVVGTLRNAEKYLQCNFIRLEKSLEEFKKVTYYFVESDSNDRTVEILETIQSQTPNFSFLSLGNLSSTIRLRTERIAFCRNEYVNKIEKDEYDSDYVLVVDLDAIDFILTKAAVESCWERNDWDVVSANQESRYFDIWALRHPDWCPRDWKIEYQEYVTEGMSPSKALKKSLYSKMINIDPMSPWIQVESAFGGLAIYKTNLFLGNRYIGISSLGLEVCEHVKFHSSMKIPPSRMFINPKLINEGVSSHELIFKFSIRVKTFLKKLVIHYL